MDESTWNRRAAELHNEIIELHQEHADRSPPELLRILNAPERMHARGYTVETQDVLAVVLSLWRADENSRFFLYDFDLDEIASCEVFDAPEDAVEAIDPRCDNVIVKRFEL